MAIRQFNQQFGINLNYDVSFTRGLFTDPDPEVLRRLRLDGRRLMCFIDDNVVDAWPKLPEQVNQWATRQGSVEFCGTHVVAGGEVIKNDPNIVDTIGKLARDHRLCRHSVVIAIGGGAVLDAIGFAASLIHRGVRFIRVPTTVLSMNDSGVGVKNGINRFGCKNFYGVFLPPDAVLCDLNFLKSLDDRIWRSGVAEAFKVAAMKDVSFLNDLINNVSALRARDEDVEAHMVIHTARLHLEHIAQGGDPFERGSSRPLDFGHWAAHKLESMTNFTVYHGEAVAIGMAIDLVYAASLGLITEAAAERLIAAMRDLGLPIYHPYCHDRFDDLMTGIEEFREHLGGQLTLAMPAPLGTQTDIYEVDRGMLKAAIDRVATFAELSYV